MSPTQKRRLSLVALLLTGIAIATFFVLRAFSANIEYFLQPEDFANNNYQLEQRYRIGGLVKAGSVDTLGNGITRQFDITDCEFDVTVQFTGILPDLFRENQAIVATGVIDAQGIFQADKVLAKHDENYVPQEAAQAVMKAQAEKCVGAEGAVTY